MDYSEMKELKSFLFDFEKNVLHIPIEAKTQVISFPLKDGALIGFIHEKFLSGFDQTTSFKTNYLHYMQSYYLIEHNGMFTCDKHRYISPLLAKKRFFSYLTKQYQENSLSPFLRTLCQKNRLRALFE